MYDLAEGHNITLKGSMNEVQEENDDDEDYDLMPEGYHYQDLLLSLSQKQGDTASMNLDTNVMYDPMSGEGLVCVNGRCVSNKRKFQVHEERELGLRSGDRRRRRRGGGERDPARRRRAGRFGGGVGGRRNNDRRSNGIPMNPYEGLADLDDEELEELVDEEFEDDYSDDDDMLFDGQDLEELKADRDGKVYHAGGQKP